MTNFSGTRGNRNADYMIVAESYGAEEARRNEPLVGKSGQELSRIFRELGIDENNCFFTNVVNSQPAGNDMSRFFYSNAEVKANKQLRPVKGLYPKPIVQSGVRELYDQIAAVSPKVIIGLGNYTLWALTDDNFGVSNVKGTKVPTGIGTWRGSQLRDSTFGIPLLPTYHPAAALRNWPWRFLIKHDLSARLPKLDRWDKPERRYVIRPDFHTAVEYLQTLIAKANEGPFVLAVDVETRRQLLACIGFAWSKQDAICIPFMTSQAPYHYWTEEEELLINDLCGELLSHPNVLITGQNFLYDAQYILQHFRVLVKISFDTMIMQHPLYPGTPLPLWHLSSLYCDWHRFWKDDGKEWIIGMDEAQFWNYNCDDCVITFEITHEIMKFLQRENMEELFKTQMKQLQILLKMMVRGVRVDRQAKTTMLGELLALSASYGEALEYLLPEDVYPRKPKASPWYTSPKQQCQVFYEALGCKEHRNRKTGQPSVDDETLEKIRAGNPLLGTMIETLQEHRSLKVFSDFANMSVGWDGRAHCTFTPTTETFRYRSSEDAFGSGRNLQNIPKGQKK